MNSDSYIVSLPRTNADPVFLDLAVSEHDEARISVPDRSRLIGLTPKGIGTPQIESFFSYLLRLAEAHAVRFVDLAHHVIGPLVYSASVRKRRFQVCHRLQRGMSGGEVETVEKLTKLSGLSALTLGRAKNLKCAHVDYAQTRYWCPACILADEEPYERLIWQLKGVTHCPEHGNPLEKTCPQCGALQNFSNLTVHIRKCIKCGADRMAAPPSNPQSDDPGIWRSQECARFLVWANSYQPGAKSPFDIFRSNLMTIVKVAGGWKPLGRALGIPSTSFSTWKRGKGAPELEKVLSIAWCANVSVIDCFTRELAESEIQIRAVHTSIRTPRPYKKRLTLHTPDLLLDALDHEIKAHPFETIFVKTIMEEIGVSLNNPMSKDAGFRDRLNAHNTKIRRLRQRGSAWQLAIQLRTVILEAKNSRRKIGLSNGWIHGYGANLWLPIRGRQIFQRMISMVNANKPLPDPAPRVPRDIQTFFDWKASKNRN